MLKDSTALRILDLYKSFRTTAGAPLEVLRGISFEARDGEMLALVGASGAGKSTLLHLVGGLERADAGSIRFGEMEVTSASASQLARLRNERIGFVFQSHHLLPDLTAAENVALPLRISRATHRESASRAASLLESIGLGERLDQPVGLLSGGEQQRVALARALVRSPRLILADEPTGNLDSVTGDAITALLTSFAREHGAIVLLATHNERAARVCDRTLLLRDGNIEEVQE
jgi:lipoprotein-releasing system ATP-binding protein